MRRPRLRILPSILFGTTTLLAIACGGSDDSPTSSAGGSSGSGGSAGTAGSAGSSGSAGSAGTAGSSGSSGTSGSSGSAGTGGTAGSAGSGGTAGTAGTAGTGGTAGTAGSGGTGGSMNLCGNNTMDPGEQCDDGNVVSGDGCESNCTITPTNEVQCATLTPLPSGTCAVTSGDASKLIVGTVLTPSTVYRGGQVLVNAQGDITCVGCDCAATAPAATKIECPNGVVSPGLINTHDHITFAQNPPYTDTGERYEHRHDWRKGKNGHTKITSAGSASADQISWAELRFLFGGATSTVGSGGQLGLLRNLDKATQEEGLNQTPVDFDTFPLGDSAGTQLSSGCDYGTVVTDASIAADDAYLPHVAEGINAFAENEFVCLSDQNPGHNVVVDKSAFIHSVGLTPTDYALMGQNGTAIIWSPRSNVTLYGDTARVTEASRLGVLIALGTDWMPSGSMNLLRELHCADSLNSNYLDHFFTDRDLWMMATANAATATATDDVIGVLAPGKVGDIAIFDGSTHADYRAVIDAQTKDVALVLRAGKILYGDANIVTDAGATGCDTLDMCGSSKAVCLQSEIGKTYSALKTAAGGIYADFFCADPDNEPSCTPKRPVSVSGSTIYTGISTADDTDGDGIPNASDNCPTVFNPIRPMDNNAQADFDTDGVGDACDICPLDANTATCTTFNPNDSDGDGVINTSDNCPSSSNPGQADSDSDGKGDVCDACPNASNPGSAACPATIYDIKSGAIAAGSAVALSNVLVTGKFASGFFLQVKESDAGYQGPDNSGVFVYSPANTVLMGDRVNLTTATISLYFGQIQLTAPTVVVVQSANEPPPAPIDATTAEVATGGTKAANLESVIVKVSTVSASDIAPAPGAGDTAPTHEYVVDDTSGGVRVNDLLYLTSPFPTLGQGFLSVTGVLELRNGNSKIEPRNSSDIVLGAPIVSSFAPANGFAFVGQNAVPTVPTPITVTMSSAPATDTFIAVGSSDTNALTVVNGGVTIPAGATSAPVLVNALVASPAVTLTATYNSQQLTTSVRVVDVAEQPLLVSLTPASTSVPPGGSASLTATLDIPSQTDVVVALAQAPTSSSTIPASITIPANQISGSFSFDASATPAASSVVVTATLGASMQSSTVNIVSSVSGLVINEVDYDMSVNPDGTEFVEIYNSGSTSVDLADYSLILVNGSNSSTYLTLSLAAAGSLQPGQYLVIGSAAVTPSAGALKINFAGATDQIQNGGPDGIALINVTTGTLVDAISYEGSITSTTITGVGAVSLVEGTAATASDIGNGSICRSPNGVDTNNAAADWKACATATPGAANP